MSSSSTTIHTSSASAASASTTLGNSATAHDPRNTVVGVVLGILALCLLLGVGFLTLRARKRQSDGGDQRGPFQGSAVWDKRHPAARIVPFGTPGAEGHTYYQPDFVIVLGHTPGKDMRIAIRRPDGAWDFTDPNEPFTPSGVSDLQPSPSPASSRTTFFSSINSSSKRDTSRNSSMAVLEYKAQESRAAQMIRLGYDARDNDLEIGDGPLPHPPPAYGQEPTSGPYATYRPSPTRDTYRT
ncbi:hypothetical protein NP233_g1513 [Leucocoprinus birnbaumii]|uniref:Uncharacterized protein n=1 Tax=Leucocoprinus birnbaumii TaxID=56174 RepID=A0AAD5W067_9AGAR|nr:hypothetical protein NP233_g1513 [Leucocoprinus birnbaumii]